MFIFSISISPTLTLPLSLSVFFWSCIDLAYCCLCKLLCASVAALVVLVCFKAISHIVTGSLQVMTDCELGLVCSLMPWAYLFISRSVSISLHHLTIRPSLAHISLFLFGWLITLLIPYIVSNYTHSACLHVYILWVHYSLIELSFFQSNEVYETINVNKQL